MNPEEGGGKGGDEEERGEALVKTNHEKHTGRRRFYNKNRKRQVLKFSRHLLRY